jgi:DNA-binding NtrC family response regulator
MLYHDMEAAEIKQRLGLLLSACQQANEAADPRPLVGLIARQVAALAAMLEPSRIVGQSRKIRAVLQTVENIRASSASVLITGERGTGKQLVASTIHQTSLRARGPFVVLGKDPAAASLAEIFRRARGGSLFLQELCELSAAGQGEILRGLDDLETDVRFLAASARDLEAETARGALRRDLYYRLQVIHIPLPPLREMPDDIPLLVDHFLERFCAEFRRDPAEFPSAVRTELARRAWPGNAGQLAAEVRVLVRGSLKEAVARLEKEMLEEALEAVDANQVRAAKALGLSRQGLINKMKRYGC